MSARSEITPKIVIIGRPNVGKSTIFNQLAGNRSALVHDFAGVTRDRRERKTQWMIGGKAHTVCLVDTGGLAESSDEGGFLQEIRHQVEVALEEATVVLVVFDVRAGVNPLDEVVLERLRISGILDRKPCIGVINKVDVSELDSETGEFFSLGLKEYFSVSAEHRLGLETLKERVVSLIPEVEPTFPSLPNRAMISVVGRPNVGKSTLVNTILGSDRMITSSIAGTTIDSVDSPALLKFSKRRRQLSMEVCLVDTAGVRKKRKTQKGVETLSIVQTKKSIERADLSLLLLDGERGVEDQDEKIGGMIEDSGSSVIIVVNKWDLHENSDFSEREAIQQIRSNLGYLSYAPIVFVSARFEKGLNRLYATIHEVLEQRRHQVPTKDMTEFIRAEAEVHNPKNAKIYLCHQTGKLPPSFMLRVNDPKKIHFSLKRHLVNSIRQRWGYLGTPIRLKCEGRDGRNLPRK